MENDQQILGEILTSICSVPFNLTRTIDERGVLLTIKVDKTDMPIVIGAKGSMIGSIRRIVKVVGWKNNANVSIRVLEP